MLTDVQALFASEYVVPETLDAVVAEVARSSAVLGIGDGGPNFDSRRMAVTVEYMKRFGLHRGQCVEIGSLEYLCSKVIWSFFPESTVMGTGHDLRTPMPFPDGYADSIICLEVIEHIADIDYAHATTLSGLFFFLEELYRVLKVGGRALVSTPNAASLWALTRALRGEPPLMYDWHFREYTVDELRRIVESIGFKVVDHRTEFVWHLWDFIPLTDFIAQAGYRLDNRGDDQFIIVEKSVERERPPHGLTMPL